MKIEVKCIRENEDGSADVMVSTDEEGTKFLVERGLLDALKEALNLKDNVKDNVDLFNLSSEASQEWIEGFKPVELGIFTLRKAYQMGFMQGYLKRK